MNDERIEVTLGAKIDELVGGMREAGAVVSESCVAMKESIEGLQTSTASLMGPFLALTALLEGGELFESAISQTADLAVNMEILGMKTGIEVEQLTALEGAARLSHVSAEELTTGVQRLSKNMEAAAAGTGLAASAFERLGIHVTSANGQLVPMAQMLPLLADKFASMQDGVGKTAIAMDIFGRSGAAMIPLLNKGTDGIAELEEKVRSLGGTMDDKGQTTALAYKEAMEQLEIATHGLERDVALGLMPTLTNLATGMSDGVVATNKFVSVGRVLGDIIKALITPAIVVVGVFDAMWQSIRGGGDPVGSLRAIDLAIREIWSTVDAEEKKHTGGLLPPPPPDAKGALMKAWEAQWLEIKEINKSNFGGLLKLEDDFWRSKLGQVKKGSDEYLAISKRIASLDEEIAKQTYEGQIGVLRAKEALEADDKAAVLADRRAELALIREHYGEASKEVQEGIRRINEIQHQMQLQSAKEWEAAFGSIPHAFNKAMQGIGTTVNSMKDLYQAFFRDLTIMGIEAGARSLSHHIAIELAKKNVTLASVTSRVAAESWAALQSIALSAWSALAQIANYAAVAMAATWAAISAIPFVGPFLAPAAAVGTGALVLGLAGNIRSAAGGYDIPAGINPMTQLHAQEMVLPAELANKVRGMTGDGGGGGGGGHTIIVQGFDSRDLRRFVQDNASTFADGVVTAAKNNHSGLSSLMRKGG